MTIEQRIEALATLIYKTIEHGDDEHRRWLKEKSREIAVLWIRRN